MVEAATQDFRRDGTLAGSRKKNLWLREPTVAEMVIESIKHRQAREDWKLYEYVVMPNHIHLFGKIGKSGLKATIEDFKRWTGHEATRLLNGKVERFWQREWFDHWSRSDDEDDGIVTYLRNNPVRGGLVKKYADWP